MDKKDRYEQLYDMIMDYEKKAHERNQRRIRIGLRCILIIPLIFLILLFWTESNKVVFLILWIVSLFALAAYLIIVEYTDYNLQERLREFNDDEREIDALIGHGMAEVEENLKNAVQRLDQSLTVSAETGEEAGGEEL